MDEITLNNHFQESATYIPNEFIDSYMTDANGEYVKIYLYLLRCMNRQEEELTISSIADHFDHTEKDVHRALKYWERVHLLRLEYDSSHRLSGICLLPGEGAAPERSNRSGCMPAVQTGSEKSLRTGQPKETPSRASADRLKNFREKDEIRELIFLAETYLKRTISQSDLQLIFSWYDELHFTPDLIEYLIESCIARDHSSLHYMQKVAEDWSEKGITTPAQARQICSQHNDLYFAVMKAFGIRGRNLVSSEETYLRRWKEEYEFSNEMICEACSRTIQNIHQASFEYADTILKNWYSSGIKSKPELAAADESRKMKRTSKPQKFRPDAGKPSKFSNFQQREYDYEQLTRALLEKSMQQDSGS